MSSNDEYLDQVLSDMELVWESMGADAIDDWFRGGKERIGGQLAEAIKHNDLTEIGRVVASYALPYLEDQAEKVRQKDDMPGAVRCSPCGYFRVYEERTPLDESREADAKAINSEVSRTNDLAMLL